MNPRRARRRARTADRRKRKRVATAIQQAVHACVPPDLPRTQVNYGWCMDVAEEARKILRDRHGLYAVVVRDDEEVCEQHPFMHEAGWTHEWIWVDGYHYDSEALMGVRRWRDLPHFRRWAVTDEVSPAIRLVPVLNQGEEEARLRANSVVLRQFSSAVAELMEKQGAWQKARQSVIRDVCLSYGAGS